MHCGTPLSFPADPEARAAQATAIALHDGFVETVFPRGAAGAVASKVIRGLGRAMEFRRLRPELKMILVTRNGFDTVNSAATNFSFFGDEFHPTDRYRFWRDVVVPAGLAPGGFAAMSEDELSVLWWRANLDWATRIMAQSSPETCLLVPYEAFRNDKRAWRDRIAQFLGTENADGDAGDRAAGPVTASVFLSGAGLDLATRHHGAYETFLRRFAPEAIDLDALRATLGAKYTGVGLPGVTTLVRPNTSYLALRRQLINARDATPLSPGRARSNTVLQTARTLRRAIRRGPRPGPGPARVDAACVIAVHNGAGTIADTLSSLVHQQGARFSEIVVVDDCSTDGTADLVEKFGQRDTIRVIRNDYNIGPAASRHKGFMSARSTFVTQVDADDLAGPEKLGHEFEAVAGDRNRIAVSPILTVSPDRGDLADFADFVDSPDKVRAIVTREFGVPRDMLLSRSLYLSCGGYASEMWKYEDWLLKMRLAAAGAEWVDSGARVGTIYDRSQPGLSDGSDLEHLQHKLYALSRLRHGFADLPRALFVEAVQIVTANVAILGPVRDVRDHVAGFVNAPDFGDRLAGYWTKAQLGAPREWVITELSAFLRGN